MRRNRRTVNSESRRREVIKDAPDALRPATRADGVFPGQVVPLSQRRDCRNQRRGFDRLREVQLEAGSEGRLAVVLAGECRQRSRGGPGDRRVERAQPADERVAILAGHGNVGQQYVDRMEMQQLECLRGRRRGQHLRPAALEMRRNDVPALLVVVHDENRQAGQ